MITLHSYRKAFGIIMIIIGALFLVPMFIPGLYIDSGIIIPVMIVALGIYIITGRRERLHVPRKGEYEDKKDWNEHHGSHHHRRHDPFQAWNFTAREERTDYIDDVSIFGGSNKSITSENFKGGNITAIFGGSKIDLRGCKLAEGKNYIDIITIFGGSTIIVPENWDVRMNVTPIFGGFSNKMDRNPEGTIDHDSTLIIKGVTFFGGGELRTRNDGY
jgi:predicted membrane protein